MKQMRHLIWLATMLGVVAGCSAGAPAVMDTQPTPTQVQLAAVVATAPSATATMTNPPPTAFSLSATTALVPTLAPEGATGGVGEPDLGYRMQPTERPAPPPPPADGLSLIVEGGTNDRLEVALTFDAGADRGYAESILDLLADYGIKASFGMTGQWAEANPDLVQRMVAEGHMLFNHTWNHASLTGANTGQPALTPDEVAWQLSETERIVWELTGYEMKPYFRPPYGDYDTTSLGYLADNGYYISIWWTCDSRGWAGWTATQIIDYCSTNLKSDEIILLHVGAAAAGDYEALPGLIESFRAQGYAFVTVEQMLQP